MAARIDPIRIVSPEFSHLKEVLKGSKSLLLSTPYFSREGLENLDRFAKQASDAEFWLALNVTHWVSGHSDFLALAELLSRWSERVSDVRIRVKSNLHAKVYYAIDQKRALIGSANLTQAGFGGNLELCALLNGKVCALLDEWISDERDRTQEIDLAALLDCVDVSQDAVVGASRTLEDRGVATDEDVNAAIDLFENVLVRKMRSARPAPKATKRKIEPGQRVIPSMQIGRDTLPDNWPDYDQFLNFLRSRKRDKEAAELLARAEGKSNLQGHVKHFFWASLMFILEHPEVLPEIDASQLLAGPVSWQDVQWVKKWREFVDRHDDEFYEGIDVSFHTVKVYLPPTVGGTTTTGGAGIGNFKRTLVYVKQMIAESAL